MKHLFTLFLMIITSLKVLSQVPNAMSYQAVIRDANNNLVRNHSVGMKISILKGEINGLSVYTEKQTIFSNDNGIANLKIGKGATNDYFSSIDWSKGEYFLKIEVDPTGGSNYTITGISQLLSVPYAIHAKTAENTFLGDYNDLTNRPTLPTMPSKTSDLTNNSGYITSPNDSDADPNNEIQHLSVSKSGDTLFLSNGNWVIISGISFATTHMKLPTLSTSSTSYISDVKAVSGGNIDNNGGADVTARGVVWNTNQTPTLSDNIGKTNDGTGIGSFTSNLTGLIANTTYYIRSYATNTAGTAYGNEVSFTTAVSGGGSGTYPLGTVHCTGTPTEVVDVTNPTTGKTWMDRNLGASQVATSSTDVDAYGDLYQWGRAADGHQCRNSATTTTLSSTDEPGHGDFIKSYSEVNYDWRSPHNDNLWQGVDGSNNPCPIDYRLPTSSELDAERTSWSSNAASGAFASPLKLPLAGNRYLYDGTLDGMGTSGGYWSSTIARSLYFFSSNAGITPSYRAYGFSVRCLKD